MATLLLEYKPPTQEKRTRMRILFEMVNFNSELRDFFLEGIKNSMGAANYKATRCQPMVARTIDQTLKRKIREYHLENNTKYAFYYRENPNF